MDETADKPSQERPAEVRRAPRPDPEIARLLDAIDERARRLLGGRAASIEALTADIRRRV